MQRILKIAAIAALLAALLSVAALAEAGDLTGAWYLCEAQYKGARFSPAAIGIEVTLTLNPDGTAQIAQNGTALPGTWTEADGAILLADESEQMTLVPGDGALTSTDDEGMVMIYRREPAPENPYETPAQTGVALADFDGRWTSVSVDLNGVLFSIEQIGGAQVFVIDAGQVTLIESGSDPIAVESAFADDSLILTDPDGSGIPMYLRLHEDGTLSARMTDNAGRVVIYFEKTADE